MDWKSEAPLRWLPRQGEPRCWIELISQLFLRAIACLPVYTAVVVTLTLIVVLLTR